MLLFTIAVLVYPGGTYEDKNAEGFNWTKNYISNLFEATALNGSENSSRTWAYFGVFFYSITCAVFFVNMSRKIPDKGSANVIKYMGILTMPVTLLIATPLHNLMLNISNLLFWTCMGWITVFVFKTRLHFLKVYCIICQLIFFYAVFVHSSSNWDALPIIQKVNTISSLVLIFVLEYFTKREDFARWNQKKTI
jgi:membrane-associated HD superfamily phosphohydrolase